MSSVQTIYHVGFYALIIRGYCFGDLIKTKWDIVVLCSVLFYFPVFVTEELYIMHS